MARSVTQFSLLDWAATPLAAIVWRELLTTLRQRRYGYLLIIAAAIQLMVAIGALLSIGGAFPWWSLAIFFLCVWVTWGIVVFGEDEDAVV